MTSHLNCFVWGMAVLLGASHANAAHGPVAMQTTTSAPALANPGYAETNQQGETEETPHRRRLNLTQAIRLALAQNKTLKAAQTQARGAQEAQAHAGLWDNPVLGLQLDDALGTGVLAGVSSAETTLAVNQNIAIGGRLSAQRHVAQNQRASAAIRAQSVRERVLANTMLRFIHVIADTQRVAVAQEALTLILQAQREAKRRIRRGAASAVEEHRAAIAVARAGIETEHAEHELLSSKRGLAAMWGGTSVDYRLAQQQLPAPKPTPEYAAVAGQISSNPQLAQLVQQQHLQQARVQLAAAGSTPDLTLQLGARRLEAPNAFGLSAGIAMPLPLFQRNQQQVSQAKSAQQALKEQTQATQTALLAKLYSQLQERNHSEDLLAALDKEMLPNARQVYKLVRQGFAAGRFSQSELLEAQQSLIQLQQERIEATETVWALTVQIQGLLGNVESVADTLSATESQP